MQKEEIHTVEYVTGTKNREINIDSFRSLVEAVSD